MGRYDRSRTGSEMMRPYAIDNVLTIVGQILPQSMIPTVKASLMPGPYIISINEASSKS